MNNQSTSTIYVAQPSLAGTYRISAQIAGVTSLTKSAVQTVSASQQALKLTARGTGGKAIVGKGLYTYGSEVYVERVVNGVVSSGAGADAVMVNLRCVETTICSAPATVTIPAGSTSASIWVAGVELGTTQLEATAVGVAAATPVSVEAIQPVLSFSSLDGQRTTTSVRDGFSMSVSTPGAAYSTNQYALVALTVQLELADQDPVAESTSCPAI
ncbi:hypothetical protein G7047_09955 [Diaphorobacter sp. HDW4A]|uniref:hypothetical protein n=1 Tax=Diaphorobacter sp. HDW4A TaxID=2714924 RepID=UPI00140DFC20|nr:hypothetical protein [Diaphorobacter sp. HDW4A]QIL78472.1 hypothetical protein G7047_09955 [Diaphorobacter sp. HDW4A]